MNIAPAYARKNPPTIIKAIPAAKCAGLMVAAADNTISDYKKTLRLAGPSPGNLFREIAFGRMGSP
jgi:hypothetical protein